MTGPGDPRPFADLQKLQDNPAAPAPEEPEGSDRLEDQDPPPLTGEVTAAPEVTDPREPALTQESYPRPDAGPPPGAAEQDQPVREDLGEHEGQAG